MQLHDFKDLKDKFKKETFFHSEEATFNEKGEILIEVPHTKLGKPKNYFLLNAVVEIPAEEGKKIQGFYMEIGYLARVFPSNSTAETLKNAPAPLIVDRMDINTGDKQHEEGKCPRCGVLTIEELNQIFPNASQDRKTQLMNAFNEANDKFGLNTCQQKAHFFAQVREEVGTNINVKDGENLNYSAEALPVKFSKFRKRNSSGQAVDKNGNPTTKNSETVPNDLAYKYGRSSQNNYTANQEMIANIAYADKEGNGDVNSGDGWRYRGRGIIQITFKGKYDRINKRINDDFPEFGITIDANNINNLREGTVASMSYWEEYGCQSEAEKGVQRISLDAIVDIVNRNTDSRNARWGHLQNMVIIFRVNECEKDNNQVSEGQHEYYIYKSGKIKHISGTEKKHTYYVEKESGKFKLLYSLDENGHGMVKIPDSGAGFDRYGTVDAGGTSGGEVVGKGDRYLVPKTVAALFGIINEVNEKGWEVHLGDMSSENGSDPWQSGFDHHAGHGHNGNRKGLDVDFRYLNTSGKSYQGNNDSSSFDKVKNKTFFELAYKYGFRKNYCTNVTTVFGESISGVTNVSNHKDHGQIGLSDIDMEEVNSVDVIKL